MSETMATAIIGVVGAVVGTLVGTVLGYLLTRKATKDERDRNDKRQAESTRAIVSLEIDRNLGSLRESWLQVNQVADQSDDAQTQKLKLARRFIELPVPAWKKEALNSQLSILATALEVQEITQVFQFYDDLAKLETLRSKLSTFVEDQRQAQGYLAKTDVERDFMEHAPEWWDEYERTISDILAKGNPLHIH